MSDTSFLDWPFFEPRHRELAAALEAWCVANLPVSHDDVDAACTGLVAALGDGGWLKHSGAGEGERLDVRSLCAAVAATLPDDAIVIDESLTAAAVLAPALQTAASRAAGSEGDLSQRLSDLTRAALVGSLFGPGVGGVVAADDSLVGPVLVGAAVLVLAAAAQRPATGSATIVVAGPGSPTRHRDVVVLLLLAALAAAAMSVYEVGLATQGGADGLSARELGFMFTGCGVVMLLAQSLVFRPRHDPLRAFNWVAPSFVATAAGLALLAWLGGRWPGALGLVLVAAGGGVLLPALVYWTSRAAGAAEATSLGWRASFTGAGQALGSLAGGFAFAVTLAGKIVLATLLLILLAAAMLALARRRAPAGLPLSVSTQER